MSAEKKWPERVWLPIDSLEDELKLGFDIFKQYHGDTQYISISEHTHLIAEAEKRGREKAMQDALGAVESYEKSFAIWPGVISLADIKTWLRNRGEAARSALPPPSSAPHPRG